MAQSLDGLGEYLQRLRSWKRADPPPLALLHRWEKELGLKDADIRAVHRLALTHRHRAFELLKEGKPEFLAELREALQLEPVDGDFLRSIIVELARHEYGGENWEALLNRLFTRYLYLSPQRDEAAAELERLFPRFRFREKKHRHALAIAAGIALGFLIGGGGLTIAWFTLRGSAPPPPAASGLPPTVDWSALGGPGLKLDNPEFRRLTLGEDAWLVVRGRLVAEEPGLSELVLSLAVVSPNEDEVRRHHQTLVSPFTPPLLPGQSLPFRWVVSLVPEASSVQSTVRIEKRVPLAVAPPRPPPEFPAGRALSLAPWPLRLQRADGLVLGQADLSVRNTDQRPLRILTLGLRWKAAEQVFWSEEKTVLQAMDTPLGPGQVQTVRFRLNVPESLVPEGDIDTEWAVLEEERSP